MASETSYQRVSTAAEPKPESSQDVHLKPRGLGLGWAEALFFRGWDGVLTLLPAFFIVLALLAVKLDGQPVSEFGDRVIELTRLSPTVYPIMFAAVAARFYKNLARWSLERPRGIKMSLLEQIFGSQSFASAVERWAIVRAQFVIGTLVLVTWSLSPIGGQSSSRLLYTTTNSTTSNTTVFYGHTDLLRSHYVGSSQYTTVGNAISTLYASNLMASKSQQRTFSDLWGRVKIPQWPRDVQATFGSWREIDTARLTAGDDHYASLIGTGIQGLLIGDQTAQYNFSVESSYIDFDCFVDKRYYGWDDATAGIAKEGYNLTVEIMRSSFAVDFSGLPLNKTGWTDENPRPKYLLYISRADGLEKNTMSFTLIKCTMLVFDLETNMLCGERGCTPVRQRRRPNPRPWHQLLPGTTTPFQNYRVMASYWPAMGGNIRAGGQASPTENYLASEDTPYGGQGYHMWKDDEMTSFSRRLTTLFNTAWQAGLDPYNIANVSSSSVPALNETGQYPEGTVETPAVVTSSREVYRSSRVWVGVLMVATLTLQLLAIAGLVLRCLIRGPDVLGFASSLTRDNYFVPISGGTAMDGAERARVIGDMRFRLGDIKPQDDNGYIALHAVPVISSSGEIGRGEAPPGLIWRPLDKSRVYA